MHQSSRSRASKLRWICLAIAILVGAFLRFYNLDLKPYWEDEIYTATRVAGFQSDAIKQAIQGQIISVAELQQFFDVDLFHNWGGFWQAIASRPEQAPLYYILARIWAGLFGSTPSVTRALPAGFSIIALGGMYQLSMVLFQKQEGAISTVFLASISPLLIRYAQENRAYSLWIVVILGSCIALLHAIRVKHFQSWLLYGVTLGLGLLTHWLFVLTIFAQFTYMALLLWGKRQEDADPDDLSQTGYLKLNRTSWRHFSRVFIVALISIIPWGYLLFVNFSSTQQNLKWLSNSYPIDKLMLNWGVNLLRTFSSAEIPLPGYPTVPSIIIFLILIYSIFRIIKLFSWQRWSLPLLICGYFSMPFLLADLLIGGRHSSIERYLLPLLVMIILILGQAAGELIHRITIKNHRLGFRILGFYFGLALLWSVAVHISIQGVEARYWWNYQDNISRVAEAFPPSTQSRLLVTEHRPAETFSLMNRLESVDKLLWIPQDADVALPVLRSEANVFLLNPSQKLKMQACKQWQSGCSLQLNYEEFGYELWSLSVSK